MIIKLVTWNINSLRLRFDIFQSLVELHNPDIICLQETKVEDSLFPLRKIEELGFGHISYSGQKSYNGVAIISKFPLNNVNMIDILSYNHKRHISCTFEINSKIVDLHNFYVPAGGDIANIDLNPKFFHKIEYVKWMAEYFKNYDKDKRVIVVGDLNIAPGERDVWSHKQMRKVVSHTDIEIEYYNKFIASMNFIDTHRFFADSDQKIYSWWSYRAMDPMKSNRGRRLDHILVSPNLSKTITNPKIHTDFRILAKPSDHVPVEISIIL